MQMTIFLEFSKLKIQDKTISHKWQDNMDFYENERSEIVFKKFFVKEKTNYYNPLTTRSVL